LPTVVWCHSGYLAAVGAVILVLISGCFATAASSSEQAAFVLNSLMQVLSVRTVVLGHLPPPSCILANRLYLCVSMSQGSVGNPRITC
jgi:hypothetical protein